MARLTFDVLPVDAAILEGVVRAFGLYFQLVNLAEERDRVRRRGPPRPGHPRRVRGRARCETPSRCAARATDAAVALRRLSRGPGPDGPSDRGPPPHRPRRAAPRDRAPPRAARRPAAHPVGRPRPPAPAARGDRAAVADRRAPPRRPVADRRGPHRDGRLRRDDLPAHAAAVPARSSRRLPAPRAGGDSRARAGRRRRRSCASARGSGAIATAIPPSRPRSPRRPSGSRPTTSCVATRLSRPACPDARGQGSRATASRPRSPTPARGRRWRMPVACRARSRSAIPDEPFRQRFGFIAERLRRTRRGSSGLGERRGGRWAGRLRDTPDELIDELAEVQDAAGRRRPRAVRLGRGAGLPLAGRDLRLPPRRARGPPARGRSPAIGWLPARDLSAATRRGRSRPSGRSPRSSAASAPRRVRRATSSRSRRPTDVTDVLDLAEQRGRGTARQPRRRSAPRVVRRAHRRRADPRRPAHRRRVPRAPRHRGRPPGGDARLLRFEQGGRATSPRTGCSIGPRRTSSRSRTATASS